MKRTRSGTGFRRGDVILVPFPFTDLSGTKRRPALVVSPDRLHGRTDDVILAAMTSRVPSPLAEFDVLLGPGDMAVGRLPRPTVVKVNKVFTCHRSLVVRRVGHLKKESVAKIVAALRRLFA